MMESLCRTCAHVREVVSAKGSVFVLCRLSQTNNRFPKYPPQPIVRCGGYEVNKTSNDEDADAKF